MNLLSMQRLLAVRLAFLLALVCSGVTASEPIQVAVFKGNGVGKSIDSVLAALSADKVKGLQVRRITVDEIQAGELASVDVLVHPGGSGSGQAKALGLAGREAVVKFVRKGGGYLGICAGAYLATNDYSWSLHLIDAKVVDRRHWARGKGKVNLKLSPDGSAMFNRDSSELEILYGQGPLLARREWDDKAVPDYQSLAIYDSEIAENGAPRGIMKGTSAIVRAAFFEGRVFCFSPHPELTDGLEHFVPIAVHWLAKVPGAEKPSQGK